jgi:ketopantoate reductase
MKIGIIGAGSIGIYLCYSLGKNGHGVTFYDTRKKVTEKKISASINKIDNFVNLNFRDKLRGQEDIVLVTTKSFDITPKLIESLTECNVEVVFLQNGLLTSLNYKNKSHNFHFGTIYGIQSSMDSYGLLKIELSNCSIAVVPGANRKKLEVLSDRQSHYSPSLIISNNASELIYEKFARWIVISMLNLLTGSNLGQSLKKVTQQEIRKVLQELKIFLLSTVGYSLDTNSVIDKIYSLPEDLVTSAYRDSIGRATNELLEESRFIISSMEKKGINVRTIENWYRHINDR